MANRKNFHQRRATGAGASPFRRTTMDTLRVGTRVRWFDLALASVFGIGSAVYMWAPHLLPFQGILFKHYKHPNERLSPEDEALQQFTQEQLAAAPLPNAPLPEQYEDPAERERALARHREQFKQRADVLAEERAKLKQRQQGERSEQ